MLVKEAPLTFNARQPLHVEIEGHADATKKGSKWPSKRRAELVRDALVNIGVPPAALSIHAYGHPARVIYSAGR
jgi:outer membrane protein OmpA-like peptidoglycan-associated protein